MVNKGTLARAPVEPSGASPRPSNREAHHAMPRGSKHPVPLGCPHAACGTVVHGFGRLVSFSCNKDCTGPCLLVLSQHAIHFLSALHDDLVISWPRVSVADSFQSHQSSFWTENSHQSKETLNLQRTKSISHLQQRLWMLPSELGHDACRMTCTSGIWQEPWICR